MSVQVGFAIKVSLSWGCLLVEVSVPGWFAGKSVYPRGVRKVTGRGVCPHGSLQAKLSVLGVPSCRQKCLSQRVCRQNLHVCSY